MIETILIARDRKTGKDVLLAGREVPFRGQLEAYKKLAGPVNDDYSNVILAVVQPSKKPLKFITNDEARKRVKPKSPTFEEYTGAGYAPESYPPKGYEEVSSPGLTAFRELQAKAKSESEAKIKSDEEAKAKADAEAKAKSESKNKTSKTDSK